VFALARDNPIPFSEYFARLNSQLNVLARATVLTGVIQSLFLVLYLFSSAAFFVISYELEHALADCVALPQLVFTVNCWPSVAKPFTKDGSFLSRSVPRRWTGFRHIFWEWHNLMFVVIFLISRLHIRPNLQRWLIIWACWCFAYELFGTMSKVSLKVTIQLPLWAHSRQEIKTLLDRYIDITSYFISNFRLLNTKSWKDWLF